MQELNGHQIYGAFKAGASRLRASQDELNRINVFPVPDGDTGTNMAVTATRAVEGTEVSESVSATMSSMADAAIAGARGNSGVIFAQFLSGFRESLADSASVSMERFARAIAHASQSARHAIGDPKEGTILSVIHAWAEALGREHQRVAGFKELFQAASPSLRESLAATTGELEALRKAGVVDAGASGFVAFMDGAHAYLEAGAHEGDGLAAEAGAGALLSLEEGREAELGPLDGDFAHRYCSEFLLAAPEGSSLDLDSLRTALAAMGDSLIVAGGGRRARVHIHTNDPAALMEVLSLRAWILEQKVDDMRRQFEDAHAAHGRIALVTDSTCDLPLDILDAHHIHVIPLFLRFGEREYLDRLTLDPDRFYDLADAAPVFPTSSQPSRPAVERLYRGLLSHYDAVVSIHVAGALSGTVETARAAAAAIPGSRVRVVDSRHLSGSLGLLVLRAAEYLEAPATGGLGLEATLDGLVKGLDAWSGKAENLVSVRSLRFMVRGGRVSPLGGVLAKVLNLKPIVSVDKTGKSRLYGASLSTRTNLKRITRMIQDRHAREPLRSWAVVHAHAPAEAQALAARLEALLGLPPLHVSEISAVVGMNAGRGAVSVVAMSE